MIAFGMVLTWFGYSVTSWGYLLLKGYDVTFRQWVSPLNPYTGAWPPKMIPKGQLLPGPPPASTGGGTSSSSGGSGGYTAPTSQYHPSPGTTGTRGPCPPGFYYAGPGQCVPIGTAPNPSLPGGR